MPVSTARFEDGLLNRLLCAYAEEVRSTASLTRHLSLAARVGDRGGFAAVKDAYQASTKRCEALRLSIQICREMQEPHASMNRPGWSVVPPATPEPVFAPHAQKGDEPIQIYPAA